MDTQSVPLILLSWLALFVPCHAAPPADLEKFVDRAAGAVIESGESVGLSVGIATGDETWLAKGYGLANVELEVPATAKTVYRIGSITKQFTAAAILLLIEDGGLSLDDPLTKFVPNYPEAGNSITVQHLLDHTSGIKSLTSFPIHRQQQHLKMSTEEMMERFKDVPLEFEPGAQFRYNNSGYYLLGVIIEKVSGMRYEEFLEKRLFEVLGLSATCYDRHDAIIPNRAAGYGKIRGDDGLRNAAYLDMGQPFSAGSLASSVEDLVRWQRGLMTGKLLKPASWKAMTTRGTLPDGKKSNYGFGVFLARRDGQQVIRHGGGINGFRSELAYFPDRGLTIAILTNTEGASPNKLIARIASHLNEASTRKAPGDGPGG